MGAEALVNVGWNISHFVLWENPASLHAEFQRKPQQNEFQFPVRRGKLPKWQITAASSYLPKQINSTFSSSFQSCSWTAAFPCSQPRYSNNICVEIRKNPDIRWGKIPKIKHAVLGGFFLACFQKGTRCFKMEKESDGCSAALVVGICTSQCVLNTRWAIHRHPQAAGVPAWIYASPYSIWFP